MSKDKKYSSFLTEQKIFDDWRGYLKEENKMSRPRKNKKFIDPRYFMDEKTEGANRDSQQINEWDMPFVGQAARMKKAAQKIIGSGGMRVPDELKKLGRYLDEDEWAEVYAAQEFFNDDQKLQQWLEEREYDFSADDVSNASYQGFEPQAEYDAPGGGAEDDAKWAASRQAEKDAEQAKSDAWQEKRWRQKQWAKKDAARKAEEKEEELRKSQEEYRNSPAGRKAARERSSYEAANTDYGGGAYGEDEEHNKYFAESTQRKLKLIEETLEKLVKNIKG